MIDHLLRLPLGYFDRRPAGELGTRVAELEKINFLTGQYTPSGCRLVIILVMVVYSRLLT